MSRNEADLRFIPATLPGQMTIMAGTWGASTSGVRAFSGNFNVSADYRRRASACTAAMAAVPLPSQAKSGAVETTGIGRQGRPFQRSTPSATHQLSVERSSHPLETSTLLKRSRGRPRKARLAGITSNDQSGGEKYARKVGEDIPDTDAVRVTTSTLKVRYPQINLEIRLLSLVCHILCLVSHTPLA